MLCAREAAATSSLAKLLAKTVPGRSVRRKPAEEYIFRARPALQADKLNYTFFQRLQRSSISHKVLLAVAVGRHVFVSYGKRARLNLIIGSGKITRKNKCYKTFFNESLKI